MPEWIITLNTGDRVTGVWPSFVGDMPGGILVEFSFDHPAHEYVYRNGALVHEPDMVRKLAENKKSKLAEVIRLADAYVTSIAKTDEVAGFEYDSWNEQAREARAWKQDPTVATPILSTIAAKRGVPVDVLREKAYEKAVRFSLLSANVTGQRQKYGDMIERANTLDDLDFEVVYEV